jgi:hypothetical protein
VNVVNCPVLGFVPVPLWVLGLWFGVVRRLVGLLLGCGGRGPGGAVVVPVVHPVHRREFDFTSRSPGLGVDQLGFVEPVDGLR